MMTARCLLPSTVIFMMLGWGRRVAAGKRRACLTDQVPTMKEDNNWEWRAGGALDSRYQHVQEQTVFRPAPGRLNTAWGTDGSVEHSGPRTMERLRRSKPQVSKRRSCIRNSGVAIDQSRRARRYVFSYATDGSTRQRHGGSGGRDAGRGRAHDERRQPERPAVPLELQISSSRRR